MTLLSPPSNAVIKSSSIDSVVEAIDFRLKDDKVIPLITGSVVFLVIVISIANKARCEEAVMTKLKTVNMLQKTCHQGIKVFPLRTPSRRGDRNTHSTPSSNTKNATQYKLPSAGTCVTSQAQDLPPRNELASWQSAWTSKVAWRKSSQIASRRKLA
ncbi:hypothetical protein I7I51_03633 [Histoplasma capsulatum]|uniref:Transmembrane protein n=1 Tax=Ajellomyces capsulatus TaxID=5037 RepID=A0A8A1M4Q5_AJECA|nr:hypothetical protein I7I51_03633 [Histoplasma capsulatum]